MKTFLTRTLSLAVCIVAAVAVTGIISPLVPFSSHNAAVMGNAFFAFCLFACCWNVRSLAVPLLFCIEVGTALSWVSLYAFWFGVWTFHSVPAARACDALGSFILLPAKWVFVLAGGDQTAKFFDPISYFGTNGLILGILLYSAFRTILRRREPRKDVDDKPAQAPRVEANVN